MNHILDINAQNDELESIFENIKSGNTILFLGAGASVGEKRYLSNEVIDYYEEYLGKELFEPDISKFVDILSADPEFSREHFDSEVVKMLQKLPVSDQHKTLASIPWREIITTNYDLLVEQAFDQIKSSSDYLYNLVAIRNQKEYNFTTDNTQIKYVKLNGCISDKSKYPLAFSNQDFTLRKKFYKYALSDLKNLPPKISFLSIGYSFKDKFGQELLEKFDSHNFRERRWILNVDPFPNDAAYPFYSQNKIAIVKCSFTEFFDKYNNWNEKRLELDVRSNRISFFNSKNSFIALPHQLALKLDNVIKQLNSHTSERYIKEIDYYNGEEPTYNLITRNVDVIKEDLNSRVKQEIINIIEPQNSFIPLIFLKGDFGIGKSTFALRMIYQFVNDPDFDAIAFQIINFQQLRGEYLVELFSKLTSKNVIFYCDEVEIESSFKQLITLRRELSIEQFNDINVFFLVPIRENILAKFQSERDIKHSHQIDIGSKLSPSEIFDLLDKLKRNELVNFRDQKEKKELQQKIMREYNSDSFVSLLELISTGKHKNDLIQAYNQLSGDAKNAFLHTALLHRFKLGMPVGWLKSIISTSWEDFTAKVLKAEGKGILIQHETHSKGVEPDILFKTKHPIIAEKLIQIIINDKDQQYKKYQNMLRTIDVGSSNSYLVINLLKAFTKESCFSKAKIQKLYDEAYSRLSEDPHFCLNYAINLQSRKDPENLRKALNIILYAESLLERRNHMFIHRRGAINFELAKYYYNSETDNELNLTMTFLNEAKDLFRLKQLLDPFSYYSYTNYISALIWELNHIEYEMAYEIKKRIQIDELFDLAGKAVTDGAAHIYELQSQFAEYLQQVSDNQSYKSYIDNMYLDAELRPYACILLYKYLEKNDPEITSNAQEYINEMEQYQDNNEVVSFLFKYYGRRLNTATNRVKFFELVRKFEFLEDDMPLSFYFFNFVAESYNSNFSHGRRSLLKIKKKYHGLNPEFHYLWLDNFGDVIEFDGIIVRLSNSRFKSVRIRSHQQTFKLISGDYSDYNIGDAVTVKLHFYLYGVMAELI